MLFNPFNIIHSGFDPITVYSGGLIYDDQRRCSQQPVHEARPVARRVPAPEERRWEAPFVAGGKAGSWGFLVDPATLLAPCAAVNRTSFDAYRGSMKLDCSVMERDVETNIASLTVRGPSCFHDCLDGVEAIPLRKRQWFHSGWEGSMVRILFGDLYLECEVVQGEAASQALHGRMYRWDHLRSVLIIELPDGLDGSGMIGLPVSSGTMVVGMVTGSSRQAGRVCVSPLSEVLRGEQQQVGCYGIVRIRLGLMARILSSAWK